MLLIANYYTRFLVYTIIVSLVLASSYYSSCIKYTVLSPCYNLAQVSIVYVYPGCLFAELIVYFFQGLFAELIYSTYLTMVYFYPGLVCRANSNLGFIFVQGVCLQSY